MLGDRPASCVLMSPPASQMLEAAKPLPRRQPLHAFDGARQWRIQLLESYGALAAPLHDEVGVILKVLADIRHVCDGLDAERPSACSPRRRPIALKICGELIAAPPERITSFRGGRPPAAFHSG